MGIVLKDLCGSFFLITVFLWLIQSLDAQHTKWMMPVKLDGEFSFENMFNIVLCGEDKAVFR